MVLESLASCLEKNTVELPVGYLWVLYKATQTRNPPMFVHCSRVYYLISGYISLSY